jgi:hypothetical protein
MCCLYLPPRRVFPSRQRAIVPEAGTREHLNRQKVTK